MHTLPRCSQQNCASVQAARTAHLQQRQSARARRAGAIVTTERPRVRAANISASASESPWRMTQSISCVARRAAAWSTCGISAKCSSTRGHCRIRPRINRNDEQLPAYLAAGMIRCATSRAASMDQWPRISRWPPLSHLPRSVLPPCQAWLLACFWAEKCATDAGAPAAGLAFGRL